MKNISAQRTQCTWDTFRLETLPRSRLSDIILFYLHQKWGTVKISVSCSRLEQLVRKAGIESKWPSSYFVSSVQNPPVCATHFSSDRNINSCGWSAQERSPQLELPMQLPPGCSDSALTNQIPPESEDQHITGCHSIIMVHFGRKRSPERTLWPPAWNSQKAPTQKSSYIVHATVKLQPSHNVWAHPKFKINVPCNEHILLQSRWSDFFFLFCSASLISWLTFNVIYCH